MLSDMLSDYSRYKIRRARFDFFCEPNIVVTITRRRDPGAHTAHRRVSVTLDHLPLASYMCRGLLYLAALKVGVLEGYCHALWQSAPSFMSSLAHLMAGSARTALRKTSLSAAGTRLDEAVRQL